ncbi:MAG: DUF2142 domain-containing protein [Candidatus Kapabacteria bacterium]|nr:DUF2142 domain-containing protein [Candidatus Kapabacteria bacterium]
MKKQKTRFLDKLSLEVLFVIIATVFGLLMVFINPPWQTNDEDRHFLAAYSISVGQIIPFNSNNVASVYYPKNLINCVLNFQGVPFFNGTKINPGKMKEMEKIQLNPKDTIAAPHYHYRTFPLSYLPHTIGIWIGSFFKNTPLWLGWFGRIGGLIFYIVSMFFIIRFVPVFKSIFFLYGLTPMVLYQASSVTYDTVSMVCCFFMVGFSLKFAFDENSFIGWREIIFYLFVATLSGAIKNGYPLIPLMIFIVPIRKFRMKEYYKFVGPLLGIYLLSIYSYNIFSLGWSAVLSSVNTGGQVSLWKDFGAGNTVSLLLSNPFKLIITMFQNIFHFSIEWAGGTIGRFGYGYILMPRWFFLIHGIVLIGVAFIESNSDLNFKLYQRILIIFIGVGSIFAIIFGMYLGSPAGSIMIFGLQGRYFIQAVPVLLLSFFNIQLINRKWINLKNLIIPAYIIIILIYTVMFMNNSFYG